MEKQEKSNEIDNQVQKDVLVQFRFLTRIVVGSVERAESPEQLVKTLTEPGITPILYWKNGIVFDYKLSELEASLHEFRDMGVQYWDYIMYAHMPVYKDEIEMKTGAFRGTAMVKDVSFVESVGKVIDALPVYEELKKAHRDVKRKQVGSVKFRDPGSGV